MERANVQEVRPATQAGKYYPADPEFLARTVDDYLERAKVTDEKVAPKAVIAPHGGFIYSGAVAGSAFAPWKRLEGIQRVVLLGPSHFYDFPGLALPDTSVFRTPLGELHVDQEAIEKLRSLSCLRVFEAAHDPEHALEVELPFVQRLFDQPRIVPLITGKASVPQVAAVVDLLWGEAETVFVISSDLSHHHGYGAAQRVDAVTAHMIQNFEFSRITTDQACGSRAIRGFLKVALKREMRCGLGDLRNSGDTAGETGAVTGYGSFHFYEL